MTVGEFLASLLLDGDAKCFDCALPIAKQCTELMAAQLYSYAEPRGTSKEKLGRVAMPASIKEAAIEKVRRGEKSTLEDSLELMGYQRQQAQVIFKDRHACSAGVI